MFHLTIHNQLFSLSTDHDIASAGGGGEMERLGIGYMSRSRVHTGTHFPRAILQDLNELLIRLPVVSDLLAEKCLN